MYAILDLEMEGLHYAPELSPENFRGLSHREWGDFTQTNPLLMETSSPLQGRLRGKTTEELVLEGFSPNYQTAKETGALRITYRDEGEQLRHRVGRHLSGIQAILRAYTDIHPDKPIVVSNLPDYQDLVTKGLGHYLNSNQSIPDTQGSEHN